MESILNHLLQKQYTKEDFQRILEGYNLKRFTTFRINTLKTSKEVILKEFQENGIILEEVPWYECAYIVKSGEEKIKELMCYQNGHIYLQSLSSMLPVLVLNPKEKEDVLDMAAAPGSKTTQMAMETKNKAILTAVEKNKIRQDRLKYNLNKQGVTCCTILNEDARNLNTFFSFDKVLLDAPCSGSGTITSDDFNNEIFSKERLEKIQNTQVQLLKKALQVLKPGKRMVYSTCSILSFENEEVLEKVRKECAFEIIPISLNETIPLLPTRISGTICVCPNAYFEGFFIALLEKK